MESSRQSREKEWISFIQVCSWQDVTIKHRIFTHFSFFNTQRDSTEYRYTLGNIPALGSPKTEIAYARQCLRKKYPVVSCYALMNSC